jgi:hypothetical protein
MLGVAEAAGGRRLVVQHVSGEQHYPDHSNGREIPKEKTMKAHMHLALVNVLAVVRLSLVLVSLMALALGSGAPDAWGGGGGW